MNTDTLSVLLTASGIGCFLIIGMIVFVYLRSPLIRSLGWCATLLVGLVCLLVLGVGIFSTQIGIYSWVGLNIRDDLLPVVIAVLLQTVGIYGAVGVGVYQWRSIESQIREALDCVEREDDAPSAEPPE
jgi:hypothetical protein